MSPAALYALGAIAVLLVLLLLVVLLRGKSGSSAQRNAVVIVGRSGTAEKPAVGKTALFKQLKNGEQPKFGLVPSLVLNEAEATVGEKKVQLIDVPGLVPSLLDGALDRAKCIVFVVDASSMRDHVRRDAEVLHDVLTQNTIYSEQVPVFVFGNKCDHPWASNEEVIRTYLERELQLIRVSAVSVVEAIGDQSKTRPKHFLGYEEEVFRFEHTAGPVTFGNGSTLKGDIAAVEKFISENF